MVAEEIMEVTLRKAAALSKLLAETARSLPLTTSITVSIYSDAKVADETASAQAKLLTNAAKATALLQASFDVRAAIGQLNATAGIDQLLTEKACIESTEKLLSGLTGGKAAAFFDPEDDDTETVAAQAQARLDALRERSKVLTETRGYGREDSITVGVLSDATATFQDQLASIRRRKVAIADELLSINMTTKVKLSVIVVALLEEFKLV